MYTSSNSPTKRALKQYTIMTLFTMVFGIIYEYFSHGVYSFFMLGMWIFPLLLGVIPVTIIRATSIRRPSRMTHTFWLWGIVTMTLGSLLTGVFEIYGSSSAFTRVYWIAGVCLFLFSLVSYMGQHRQRNEVRQKGDLRHEHGKHFQTI